MYKKKKETVVMLKSWHSPETEARGWFDSSIRQRHCLKKIKKLGRSSGWELPDAPGLGSISNITKVNKAKEKGSLTHGKEV